MKTESSETLFNVIQSTILDIYTFTFSVSNQTETPNSESECNLMDYGLLDLHTGLPQRSYSRSEAKVDYYYQN